MNVDDRHIPERILFQWHVTDRCNLSCGHCYRTLPPGSDPSLQGLLAILGQFGAFVRTCRAARPGRSFGAHVTVTGGEPFVREDLLLLLERLAEERDLFSFAVLTNGTLLTSAAAQHLARLGPSFVQVSIDGTRETHDWLRGAGSYHRAVAGIELLMGAGIPVYLSFTAHRGNYRDFPAVARLGRRLGVARVWSDRLVPCSGETDLAENHLRPDEARHYVRLMERERRRGGRHTRVALHRSLQFIAGGTIPYRCTAGDTLVTILPNGDLCPCRRMPIVVGNVHRDPLDYLYRYSELFGSLRRQERVSSGCENCFYARTCGGGARCISWAVHGDPFRADPGCWLAGHAAAQTRGCAPRYLGRWGGDGD